MPDHNLNNNLYTFGANGKLVYNDTVWEDLRFPAAALKLGGIKDPGYVKIADNGAGSTGVFLYHFDAASEEELFCTAQMPHRWKEGTSINPHVHWAPTTTGTGVVVWAIEYVTSNINGTFGNTALATVNDAGDGTAKKHQIADFTPISMSGKTMSCITLFRIYRKAADAADTYAADAALLEFDIHFEIDAPGSAQEYTK